MFNAAGLMVPDPSIMLPPIPFIDDDAGRGAEYMAASLAKPCWSPLLSHRPSGCARRARRVSGGEVVGKQRDDCLMTILWRGFVACREWSRAKKA